jgi:hypothetical protein
MATKNSIGQEEDNHRRETRCRSAAATIGEDRDKALFTIAGDDAARRGGAGGGEA